MKRKGGSVFRSINIEHMDKTQGVCNQEWEWGWEVVAGGGGGEWRRLYVNNNKKSLKEKSIC